MTRVGQRILVQRVEDMIVILDEASQAEIVMTFNEAVGAVRATNRFLLQMNKEVLPHDRYGR